MDLKEQLKKLFPNHNEEVESPKDQTIEDVSKIFIQQEPIICKYEKKGRKGKPVTLMENYLGNIDELKILVKEIKTKLGVGGSIKDGIVIIQGDYREKIMTILKEKGFKVKRVGG